MSSEERRGSRAEIWELRLYVAGQTAKSVTAFANLKRVCEEHLAGKYRIEVIDLAVHPQLVRGDQIIAIPTLVRKLPQPIRKIIGDLSYTERRPGRPATTAEQREKRLIMATDRVDGDEVVEYVVLAVLPGRGEVPSASVRFRDDVTLFRGRRTNQKCGARSICRAGTSWR